MNLVSLSVASVTDTGIALGPLKRAYSLFERFAGSLYRGVGKGMEAQRSLKTGCTRGLDGMFALCSLQLESLLIEG